MAVGLPLQIELSEEFQTKFWLHLCDMLSCHVRLTCKISGPDYIEGFCLFHFIVWLYLE